MLTLRTFPDTGKSRVAPVSTRRMRMDFVDG